MKKIISRFFILVTLGLLFSSCLMPYPYGMGGGQGRGGQGGGRSGHSGPNRPGPNSFHE